LRSIGKEGTAWESRKKRSSVGNKETRKRSEGGGKKIIKKLDLRKTGVPAKAEAPCREADRVT